MLATCTFDSITVDGGVGASIGFVSSYYNLADVGRSDVYMKQCIQSGGDWKAIPRDSDEYHAAQRAETRQRAEKLVDSVQGAQ